MVEIDYLAFEPGSAEHDALVGALIARGASRLAEAMTRCERIFALGAPSAPGLSFFGAEMPLAPPAPPRVSSSGTGLSAIDALTSCLGELVERASQYERAGDIARTAPLSEMEGVSLPEALPALREDLARAELGAEDPIDWIAGRRLDGREVFVPADWCVRRSAGSRIERPAGTALSTGLAAGPTFEAAIESALLELVERDAAALWWRGGVRPRPLPSDAAARGGGLVAELRRGATQRTTSLLDLTTDLGIPVIAAFSLEPDGKGFVCGTAARRSHAAALESALRELASLELGLEIARLREAAGTANAGDRRYLDRAALDIAGAPLLTPAGDPLEPGAPPAEPVAARLLARGLDVAIADLTRPDFAVPVVMALAPALQLMPGGPVTERLLKACETAETSARWTEGASLY